VSLLADCRRWSLFAAAGRCRWLLIAAAAIGHGRGRGKIATPPVNRTVVQEGV
jgi:hypothetical protein